MDVREALLKAAVKVFAEVGSRGATTRRIAQEAGVNEVTLFRHFQSKDDLMVAALQHFAQQATLRDLPHDPVDPAAELGAWCRDHFRELYKIRSLLRKTMSEYEEHPARCAHGMQVSVRIAETLNTYVRRLRAKGLAGTHFDERAATSMLMGAMFSDALCRDTMPERYPYSMRDAIDQYVQLFLRAIGAPAATTTAADPAAPMVPDGTTPEAT
jgi:AcrR family transcriptional regulator